MNKYQTILKFIASIVTVAACWILNFQPVQNSAGVNQLSDTPTSSFGVSAMNVLIVYSPILMLVLLVLIWWKTIKQLFVDPSK